MKYPIPARLFHGTNKRFERFSQDMVGSHHNTPKEEIGEVYFFTTDILTAKWYAESASENHGGSPTIIEAEISFNNPMVVDFDGTGIETLFDDINEAKSKGHDGLITLNYDDGRIIDQYIAFEPNQITIVKCESAEKYAAIEDEEFPSDESKT